MPVLRGLDSKDKRRRCQILPLHCSVERRATIRENAIDTAIIHALGREPSAKLLLLVRRDFGDRLVVPELLPVGQSVPCRRCARKFLCVVGPVVDEHALDQDPVWTDFTAGLVVFDDPIRECESGRLKICCAKADTARLSLSSIVPGPAPGIGRAIASGLLAEPVRADLAGLGRRTEVGLSHGVTVCR